MGGCFRLRGAVKEKRQYIVLPLPHTLVLFGLKGCANGVGTGGCKAGAYCDLFSRAVAVPLVVFTVFNVTGDAVVDLAAAIFIVSIHHAFVSPFVR